MDDSPAAPPPDATPPGPPVVRISKDGETAPLPEILALVDKNCRHCSGTGLVRMAAAPGRAFEPLVCGCGVIRFKRRRARIKQDASRIVGETVGNKPTDARIQRRVATIKRELGMIAQRRSVGFELQDDATRARKLRRRLETLA